MENETKFRAGIVISLLGFLVMTFEFFEKDRIFQEYKVSTTKQIDSLKNKFDSLYDENFIKSVELGRDELTWEYVKEKFPNVYNNAMNYKSHETE
jgi:hypothetical protein